VERSTDTGSSFLAAWVLAAVDAGAKAAEGQLDARLAVALPHLAVADLVDVATFCTHSAAARTLPLAARQRWVDRVAAAAAALDPESAATLAPLQRWLHALAATRTAVVPPLADPARWSAALDAAGPEPREVRRH